MDENMMDRANGGEDNLDFKARLNNPNIVTCGLRGIANGKREQHVQVEVIPQDGIRFITTDPTKSLQGCASMNEKLFEEWYIRDEQQPVCFRVNLAILLDCLTMGTGTSSASTGLLMEYRASVGALTLQLIETESITECVIRTLADDTEEEQALDFATAFRASDINSKAIVHSEQFRDAFMELAELPGASIVAVSMNSVHPMLRMSAEGDSGSCFIDFGSDSFSLFQCTNPLLFTYKLSLLERASKPLAEAEKTFMRINGDGILSLQNLIKQPQGEKTYVDFFVLACEDGRDIGGPDESDELQEE
jgi:hypothetical protein